MRLQQGDSLGECRVSDVKYVGLPYSATGLTRAAVCASLQAKFADATSVVLDGKSRRMSLTFTETEWKKDPKNSLVAWTQPSKCEMVEVLTGISSLRILGDHTRWYESVAIDSVSYSRGTAGVPADCASKYYKTR